MRTIHIGTERLAAHIREVSSALSNVGSTDALSVVAILRAFVEPGCHVGRGAEMDSSDEGFRLQLEWYAGQLLSMLDNQQWVGINSWINCTDKFTTRKGIE